MNRKYAIAGVALGAALVSGGVLTASADQGQAGGGISGLKSTVSDGAESVLEFLGLEDEGQPGVIDDGEELLPQAQITLDQAITAAQKAVPGKLGEVDLEYYDGRLVFNVDSGNADVKVDAATGAVIGQETDD
jgi:uncharacterized membrane protein YkoI